ncbi:MAG: hypothetical protein ABI051_13525 [Vicinamibacterales bacterium]
MLNHVEGGPQSTRVYDRYSNDREKRSALEIWARELARILEDTPRAVAEVVPMRRMRA